MALIIIIILGQLPGYENIMGHFIKCTKLLFEKETLYAAWIHFYSKKELRYLLAPNQSFVSQNHLN